MRRERNGTIGRLRTPSDPDPARRVRVPTSSERIREGDTLVVAGSKKAVDALLQV